MEYVFNLTQTIIYIDTYVFAILISAIFYLSIFKIIFSPDSVVHINLGNVILFSSPFHCKFSAESFSCCYWRSLIGFVFLDLTHSVVACLRCNLNGWLESSLGGCKWLGAHIFYFPWIFSSGLHFVLHIPD